VEFLAAFAGKLAIATLKRRLTGIHRAHLERGLVSPVYDEAVKKTMAGIKRTFGTRQRQVRPILKDDVLRMLVMVDRQKPKKTARDKALLLLGFAGAFPPQRTGVDPVRASDGVRRRNRGPAAAF
jgi:hypothetical protein